MRPEPPSEILAPDHDAGTFEQGGQDAQRLLLQREADAALPQLADPDVHLEGAEPEDGDAAEGFNVSMLSILNRF